LNKTKLEFWTKPSFSPEVYAHDYHTCQNRTRWSQVFGSWKN